MRCLKRRVNLIITTALAASAVAAGCDVEESPTAPDAGPVPTPPVAVRAETRPRPAVRVEVLPLYTFHGRDNGARFGCSVASAGDVDGDGVDDLLVGSLREANPDSRPPRRPGSVRLFSGADGGEIRTLRGDGQAGNFGVSVANVGDADRDGVPDHLVGVSDDQSGSGFRGSARLYSGGDGTLIHKVRDDANLQHLGFRVADAGDLTDDGVHDLLVASPWAGRGSDAAGNLVAQVGVVLVADGATGRVIRTTHGRQSHEALGRGLAVLGDVDGDGVTDHAASFWGLGTGEHGGVRLFSGGDGSVIWEQTGTLSGEELGIGLAAVDDLDGDGVNDVLAGCRRVDPNRGRASAGARVLGGADGSVLRTHTPPPDARIYGICVAGLGDLDGDGVGEYLIGDQSYDGATLNEGRVHIYGGADGRLLATLTGESLGEFGFAACALGDLDGDGRGEFAVGAPDGGPDMAGRVTVFTTRIE